MTHYAIRTCRIEDGNLVSPSRLANGFIWPREGQVVCPDWDPEPECGNGLHALRVGDRPEDCDQHPGEWVENADVAWLILKYDPADMVQLDGKIKLSKCTVVAVFEGVDAPRDATRWLRQHGVTGPVYHGVDVGGRDSAITVGSYGTAITGDKGHAVAGDYGTATAGYNGTAIVGRYGTATADYSGTAIAGDCGTATAGHSGTATAGDHGHAIAGYGGTATAGRYGIAIAGNGGTAIADNDGTAIVGYGGTATAGDYGTATAGDGGTATAGDYGTAAAGNEGTAAAGTNGQLQLKYFDNRQRTIVAYVGEHAPGLLPGETVQPGVKYQIDSCGQWYVAK